MISVGNKNFMEYQENYKSTALLAVDKYMSTKPRHKYCGIGSPETVI